MTISRGDLLLLITTGFIILFRIHYTILKLWKQPLDHGRDFSLGV